MEQNYLKVENKEHLYRNVENNSIINSDYESYKVYEEMYRRKYNEKKRIESLENDINSMKSDLKEIKDLLRNFSK
jgi:hypothetical protein